MNFGHRDLARKAHDFINKNKRELFKKYGECSLLVLGEQVIGHGCGLFEAMEGARERHIEPYSCWIFNVENPDVLHFGLGIGA